MLVRIIVSVLIIFELNMRTGQDDRVHNSVFKHGETEDNTLTEIFSLGSTLHRKTRI